MHCGLTNENLQQMLVRGWFPEWPENYFESLLETRFPNRYGEEYPEGARVDK